jgi:salicylate hydroxylase
MPDGPAQVARDELFQSQLGREVEGPFPSRWTCPQVQPWLYGYDAHKEVEEAVKQDPFPSSATTSNSEKRTSQIGRRLSSWLKGLSQ